MHVAHLAHALLLQSSDNPIDGVTPDFDFGGPFNTWWKSVFAALWGLVIIIALAYCLMAIIQMRSSKNNPMQHQQGKESLIHSGIALGISIAFGVIVTAVFYVAG